MDDAESRKGEALDRLLWSHPFVISKEMGVHKGTVKALVKEGWATVKDSYDDVWPPRPIMAKDKNWEAKLTSAGIQEAFRRGYKLHTEERCMSLDICPYHTPHKQNRITPPAFRQATEGTIEVTDKLIPVRITASVMENVFTETGTWQKDDGDGTVHKELHALAANWSGSKPVTGEVTVDTLGWMLDTVENVLALNKLPPAQARSARKFLDGHQEAFTAAGGVEAPVGEPKKAPVKKTAAKKAAAKKPQKAEAPQRGVMLLGEDGMHRLPILNVRDELIGWTVYADPKGKPVRNDFL